MAEYVNGSQELRCLGCGRLQWIPLASQNLACKHCIGTCSATGRIKLSGAVPYHLSLDQDITIRAIDPLETYKLAR